MFSRSRPVVVSVVLLLVWITLATSRVTEDPLRLRFVATLFRHGARSPLLQYYLPGDQERWKEVGPGFLSHFGKGQTVWLGREFRKKYIDREKFLSPEFVNSEMYVRSSDVDRSLMSAQGFLAGLYPHGKSDIGSNVIPLIPIHSMEIERDFLMLGRNLCPEYTRMVERLNNETIFLEKNKQIKPFLQEMSNLFHTKFTLHNFTYLMDSVLTNHFHKFKMNGIDDDAYNKIKEIGDWLTWYHYPIGASGRMIGGSLLGDIVKRMQECKTPSFCRAKFAVYSGHDITITSLLSALSIRPQNIPDFSSYVTIELYTSKTESLVKIIYNGDELLLPDCGAKSCSLEAFIQATQNSISPPHVDECFIDSSANDFQNKYVPQFSVVTISVFIIFFLICSFVLLQWRSKSLGRMIRL
eukprot:TRINITY_DN2240_c0_g1_i2.p1 TRINITY_DN2240_c0_g1~~TRINITY_DN2240_c0_g1_i2.p1  ORF type:complete len:411 (-),score=58.22 TRINITY_DN2240_c0_g1_i2:1038-2270(-)